MINLGFSLYFKQPDGCFLVGIGEKKRKKFSSPRCPTKLEERPLRRTVRKKERKEEEEDCGKNHHSSLTPRYRGKKVFPSFSFYPILGFAFFACLSVSRSHSAGGWKSFFPSISIHWRLPRLRRGRRILQTNQPRFPLRRLVYSPLEVDVFWETCQ